MKDGYNVLTDEAYQQQMFEFDLQLFGGGGGKNGIKIIGTLAMAAVGYFNPGMFGLSFGAAQWGAAVLGAALFSSVWSAFNRKNGTYDYSNIQRFERSQETMSSDGQLPVVYGRRQITGNQTYHKTDSDSTTLWKHVVLCEGGIEGIESVTANDLLVPTGEQSGNTVFTLQNVKYSDARVSLNKRHLRLHCNNNTRDIYLCVTDDLSSGDTYWEYQVSISSLVSYINRLGEGWQAFPTAATNKYPGNLWSVGEQNVYNRTVNFNMDTVSGGTEYTLKDCVIPDNYEEVGGYPNMAWLDMKFIISSELNGNPSVSCLVRGRKIYDVRTGKTAYSTNPAMCVRDFILSKRYGLGKWFTENDLDADSWKESADYCDEVITFLDGSGAYVSAKRYELNMVIDTKRTALEWLQEMLANFCGYLVYSNGKLKLKIEKQTDVSYKFDDDTCSDLKISPLALSETPNRYNVTIIDPLNNWATVKCICDDYADQKQRQKIITKDVSLEGVTSQNQALRLARFYRDYNLVCPMQLSFSTGMQAMHLEPGDVVTISYHGVFKDMPIRISEIKETNKGTFEISGRQYNDTIYGDALGGGIHWYTYSEIPTPYAGEVPNVTNLTYQVQSYIASTGTVVNAVKLSWDALQYQFLSKYVVEYTTLGSDSWVQVGSTSDTSCLVNVNLDWTYTFRVRTENTAGRLSTGTKTGNVYVSGYNEPPSSVTGLTYTISNGNVNLRWNANSEPDIKGYNVYQGIGNVGFDSCELVVENTSANMTSIPIDTAQTYTFYVEAVDTAGNISPAPTSCLVSIEPLGDVQNFYAVKNGDTIQFFWDEIKNCNYELRWGSSWNNSKTVAKINSNVYTLFFPLVGTQSFFIKAYNGYNLYSQNASWLSLNCTPMVTRNMIATFDEGGNGWQGVKVALETSGSDLILRQGNSVGEYYTELKLNKEVEARNWIEYDAVATSDEQTWEVAEKQWEDYDSAWVAAVDSKYVLCENYISTKINENYLYSFDLNKNTDGASKATGVTYDSCRFTQGAVISEGTTLEYEIEVPQEFYMSFNVKVKDNTEGFLVFATLASDNYWLRVERYNKMYALMDSLGQRIELNNYFNMNDVLSISIKQTVSSRTFRVNNVTQGKNVKKTELFEPLGVYTELRLRA
jgi:hypothetical protein